jgi:uncharacterized protein YndB with AHSA1/START domain
MTTSTRETTITLDDEVPIVRIVREFDAPPAKVFRAHADPELFARWNAPHGMETVVHQLDCRTGGAYRYTMAGEEFTGGFYGCFHEVRPDELIVQTFSYDELPDAVSLDRLVFEDLENGRTRLSTTSLLESFADRDELVASGMEVGVRDGYDKLDAVLADAE